MLSNLPNLADRNFILGFFLPTLLFVLAGAILFSDVAWIKALIDALTAQDIGKAAYVILAIWVIAVLLLMINHPLYRFLEGYYFPGQFGEWLKNRHREKLADDLAELATLHQREIQEGDDFPPGDSDRYDRLKQKIVSTMPSNVAEVLPTSFGNAIKAFEVYPRDVYGADGVTVWLRLGSVMSKDVADDIQQMRTQIDFLINSCLFSIAILVLGLARAIEAYQTAGFTWLPWAWPAVALILAIAFYRFAVFRVPAWGELVMSAFDCFLPDLAKKLGYDLPATTARRQEFWSAFSQQLIYRADPAGNLPFLVEDWTEPATPAPAPAPADGAADTVVVAIELPQGPR